MQYACLTKIQIFLAKETISRQLEFYSHFIRKEPPKIDDFPDFTRTETDTFPQNEKIA